MKQNTPTKHLTPSDIGVLLHYHLCPEEHPRVDTPAVKDAIRHFQSIGVLIEDADLPGKYRTTRKGHAYVTALCCTPPPREVYVNEAGEVLEPWAP